MRNGRLQKGAPGSSFSAGDMAVWEDAEVHIVRKRVAESGITPGQIRKKAKASERTDRLASLDVINMSRHIRNHHRTKF